MNQAKWIVAIGVLSVSCLSAAANEFAVSTDYFQYSGTIVKYATLADATNDTNAILSGTFQTRDGSFYLGNNAPTSYLGAGWENSNVFLTTWWYTTDPNNGAYSGWGNPNNTNDSFVQLYDQTASSRSSVSAGWGPGYSALNVSITGANAGSSSFARLWPTNAFGGGAQGGTFLNYSLNFTVSGLNGVLDPSTGMYVDSTNRGSVSGSFKGIFENTSTSFPGNNGFYRFNLSLSDSGTSWAEQQTGLNGALSPTFYAAVPEPASMAALGLGVAGLVARRKRANR